MTATGIFMTISSRNFKTSFRIPKRTSSEMSQCFSEKLVNSTSEFYEKTLPGIFLKNIFPFFPIFFAPAAKHRVNERNSLVSVGFPSAHETLFDFNLRVIDTLVQTREYPTNCEAL